MQQKLTRCMLIMLCVFSSIKLQAASCEVEDNSIREQEQTEDRKTEAQHRIRTLLERYLDTSGQSQDEAQANSIAKTQPRELLWEKMQVTAAYLQQADPDTLQQMAVNPGQSTLFRELYLRFDKPQFDLAQADSNLQQVCIAMESPNHSFVDILSENIVRLAFSLDPLPNKALYPKTISEISDADLEKIIPIVASIIEGFEISRAYIADIFFHELIKNKLRAVLDRRWNTLSRLRFACFETFRHLFCFLNFVRSLKYINQPIDQTGRTLVMYAAMFGSLWHVEFLLQNGARPKKQDTLNMSALDYAQQYNHVEIIHNLQNIESHQWYQQHISHIDSIMTAVDNLLQPAEFPHDLAIEIASFIRDTDFSKKWDAIEDRNLSQLMSRKTTHRFIRIFALRILQTGIENLAAE